MVEDERERASGSIMSPSVSSTPIPPAGALRRAPLVGEIGAGGIAEAVALAAVARREASCGIRLGRIGEAPRGAQLAVQPLGRGLGGLERQRREGVTLQVLAGLLPRLDALAHAGAGGGDEERDVVAAAST